MLTQYEIGYRDGQADHAESHRGAWIVIGIFAFIVGIIVGALTTAIIGR